MFEDFTTHDVDLGEMSVHAQVGGDGPPVLLLHGYPQCHAMWHRVAPELARSRTVVAADLRGYGDSGKPLADDTHAAYSKRAMAADQVALMRHLGFDSFAVVGHDRGGRVAHRMALDAPDAVERVAVLDIVPTRHMFGTADQEFGLAYYHWFFLAQPDGLPERMIGADPDAYLLHKLRQWSADGAEFDDAAVASYLRHFRDPATVRASCEDYRAAASVDLEHDDADAGAGRRVEAPLLALWGAHGFVGHRYDVLDVWRSYATDVRGRAVDSGHFPAEEAPAATLALLEDFLADRST